MKISCCFFFSFYKCQKEGLKANIFDISSEYKKHHESFKFFFFLIQKILMFRCEYKYSYK